MTARPPALPGHRSHDQAWSLAVACARYAAGIDGAEAVAVAARESTSFADAARMAKSQGLGALLVRALVEAGETELLAEHGEPTGPYSARSARALATVRLLANVHGALERAGVPSIPYKGPVLSLQLYGDIAMRQSVDLDIVVPRESYATARRTLIGLGLLPRGGHSERQERTLFRWVGQASFGSDDDHFIELHWRFAPLQLAFALTPEEALARAPLIAIAGHRLRTLAPNDLAVTLAMHGMRHLYERLEWLAGLARLIASVPDPAALLEHARALRARRMLLVSVGLTETMLGAPLSDGWRAALSSDRASREIVVTLGPAIVDAAIGKTAIAEGIALQRLLLRLMDSRRDALRSLVRAALLPTEREWEFIRLPDALAPLYHLVRPVRLAAVYAQRAVSSRRHAAAK